MNKGFLGMGLLALTLSTTAQAAVYRCEAGGKVSFSDRACQAFAETYTPQTPLVILDAGPEADLAGAWDERMARQRERNAKARAEGQAWAAANAARNADAERIRNARVAGRAARGMTAAELRQTLGEPDTVVRSDEKGGDRERWTFDKNGEKHSITLDRGTVTGVRASKTRSPKPK